MEDEHLDEFAHMLLTQAAKFLESSQRPNPNYRLFKANNDKWSITYNLETPFGNLVGFFNPLPAVKVMVKDTFDVSRNLTPELARANFEALFMSVLRLVHYFSTMMQLTLKKHFLLSVARPHYEYEEFLSSRSRAHGEDVPMSKFKDVLDSLPTLKKINEIERRLAGVGRSGRPRRKGGTSQPGLEQQVTTLRPFSHPDSIGGLFGLPSLSEYEREQHDLWRKVFWAVYNAKMRGMANEYLHQEYLADEILGLNANDAASSESAARRLRRTLKKYGLSYAEIRREATQRAARALKPRKKRAKSDT